ncbi:MAG: FAD-binding protein [Chloroflexi bacterium]|nr:FAD-binding protein [Chloroflexota bacterium]
MDRFACDVLVIGSGSAGMTAALAAASLGARVTLVSKEPIGFGNTRISGGGLSRPGTVPTDGPHAFYEDIMASGEGISDPRLAWILASEAMSGVDQVETLGHWFHRDSEGRLSPSMASRPGGHRIPRSVRAFGGGKSLGQSLRTALVRAGIPLFGETLVTRLLVEDGRVKGALAMRIVDSQPIVFAAKTIILATGGAGYLYYPHTDCMPSAAGDGYALALEAGAELVDMEFMQFLPFAVASPRAKVGKDLGDPGNFGPRARLLNGDGELVLSQFDRMTRGQVSRAIAEQVAQGKTSPAGGLYLDLSDYLQDERGRTFWERVKGRDFMEMGRVAFGSRAYRWEEPWEVLPTAHTTIGGVRADEQCRTRVLSLYVAGETMGGVHGANRLGSAALAETMVFGRRAGRFAAEEALGQPEPQPRDEAIAAALQAWASLPGRTGSHRPIKLIRRLQQCMWRDVGIARMEASCQRALDEITEIAARADDLAVDPGRRYNTELLDALNLRFMLTAAEAMGRAALERRESRGAHFRLDHPERDDAHWQRNIVLWREGGHLRWRLETVPSAMAPTASSGGE